MKKIDSVLRTLSMLYDFNKKLRTFTLHTKDKQASQAMEPAVATGKMKKLIRG